MTSAIIITVCALLIVAYVFTLTSAKTRIPSVLLLLIVGWGIGHTTTSFDVELPDMDPILSILATIGLVLIVLEGSLELKLDRSKIGLVTKSFFGALGALVILSFSLAWAFSHFGGYPFRNSLINAIPLCVISSAIAIPSVVNLQPKTKEFVIYESSLSDILGVVLFNFIALNEVYNVTTFGTFGLQVVILLVISLVATIGLSLLLARISHHVKFVPIILLVVLIYTVLKEFHLPGLIFILLFGIFVGHLDELKRIPWIRKLVTYSPEKEVEMFKVLTIEGTFLIRSLFFLVFGFLLETQELFNAGTMLWALAMVALFFTVRIIQLKLSQQPLMPLLFVAPRGLITILLFLYITPEQSIDIVNRSLIIQVIVFTVVIMTIGMMLGESETEDEKLEKGKDNNQNQEIELESSAYGITQP